MWATLYVCVLHLRFWDRSIYIDSPGIDDDGILDKRTARSP